MNKNENVNKDKILKYVNEFDYKNGLDLVRNVRLIKHTRNGYEHTFEFNVNDNNSYFGNTGVQIDTFNGSISDLYCSCSYFGIFRKCKHIAACLIKNYNDIFKVEEFDSKLITDDLLSPFTVKEETKPVIKKEVNIDIELHKYTYYSDRCDFKFKIGIDKMYSLNKKIYDFSRAYLSKRGTVTFGKNFIYNPNIHFFNEKNCNLIEYLLSKDSNYFNLVGGDTLSSIIMRLSQYNIKYYINDNYMGTYSGISQNCPLESYLEKKNDNYVLTFTNIDNFDYVGSNPPFVFFKGKIVQLDDKTIDLINKLYRYNVNSITITQDKIDTFKNGLLPKIKNEIKIDDNVAGEIVIGNKPKVKLYFDSKYDGIICNILFNYGNKELNYFDVDKNIIRDEEFENEVVEDVYSYNFKKENKRFIMDDIDYIGAFIEEDMVSLAKNYEVYSTENFKKNKMIKTMVKSSFSIGQDNILSYHFDLNGISDKEMNDMINSYKNKKKYYRLKSGDIVNLENDENLMELNNLLEDMDINGVYSGTIPKYRAIYLSSLKDNKYSIIETNNLFDDFINKFNQYKDADIKFSKKDLNILRDYQVTGVKWLYNIYKCELGGILADEMGLGKSIQFIYLLKEVIKENKDAKILIVCPTSLVYNWQKEFEKFGQDISLKVMYGHKEKRHNELNNIKENVIITSYGLIREDEEYYNKLDFEVMAIDEAQSIKNATTGITKCVKKINAKVKFALTGTPLENNVTELWSIFDYIMPGYLTNLKDFNTKYGIKDIDDESTKALIDLQKQIAPFILRRKKTDVLTELPPKIENNIFIDLNEKQKSVYAMEVKKTRKEMDEIIEKEGYDKARFKILQLLTKLRQLCIDPKIVYENYTGESSKITEVTKVCKEVIANGHKILLFSSFKTAIDILNREFTNEGISTYVIDGSVGAKKRNELVKKFNNDDTNCFLITIKSGGTGLNLTSADVVIHLDLWWNPQVENQATDRAHRIGQKNTVEVIKLICKGTIEEKILELQNKKKLLADALIEGEDRDKNLISKLSADDIKDLLSTDNEQE